MSEDLSPQMQAALLQVQEQYEKNQEFTKGITLMGGKSAMQEPGEGIGIDSHEREQDIEIIRNFGEIVRSGPSNEREGDLLTRAQAYLSPSEFRECVNTNANPQEVEEKVTGFEMYQEVQIFFSRQENLEREQELEEMQKEQEEQGRNQDKDKVRGMSSLGEEYGVLSEVAKALSQASLVSGDDDKEMSPPTTPSKEQDQDKGMSR